MSKPVVHRSGFVNIIGNPNVGKSTLMNALVGERLSIVTAKAQTTRHRIMGIINGDDFQIIFTDTPGILRPSYKLQECMMEYVDMAIGDADVVLYLTDVVERSDKNAEYIERLQRIDSPLLLVINKIDLSNQQDLEQLVLLWRTLLPKAEIFPISALEKFNLESLYQRIVSLLPPSPPWYDKALFTDRSLRFFASEIIREKILQNYDKEVPYCTEVVIESFKEEEKLYRIEAVINVMRESQKGILIGARGNMLKKVGTQARIDMEEFFERKVFLQLYVKVAPNWRENKQRLKQFGYM